MILSLTMVCVVDYVTPADSLFIAFYFFPVSLCAWNFSRTATLLMALFSGAMWWIVDKFSGHAYTHEGFRYWNAFNCFVSSVSGGLILAHLKGTLNKQVQSNEELSKALDEQRSLAGSIHKLKKGLCLVCEQTKQIKVDGKWISFDEFLSTNLGITVIHGTSPEAIQSTKMALENHRVTPLPTEEGVRSAGQECKKTFD